MINVVFNERYFFQGVIYTKNQIGRLDDYWAEYLVSKNKCRYVDKSKAAEKGLIKK